MALKDLCMKIQSYCVMATNRDHQKYTLHQFYFCTRLQSAVTEHDAVIQTKLLDDEIVVW